MFVGATGVGRVVQRTVDLVKEHDTDDVRPFGGVDVGTLQRYLNFHYSVSLDLFGADKSTNAAPKGEEAVPLQQIAARIRKSRTRYKITIVALARHILRIVFYVLRDGLPYDPSRLKHLDSEEDAVS